MASATSSLSSEPTPGGRSRKLPIDNKAEGVIITGQSSLLERGDCSMDKDHLKENNKHLSKGVSSKELHPGIITNTVRISKSDEAVTHNTLSITKTNSIKSEKDVRFAAAPSFVIDIPDKSTPDKERHKDKEKDKDKDKDKDKEKDKDRESKSPRDGKDKDKDRDKEIKSPRDGKLSRSNESSRDTFERQDSKLSHMGSPKVPRKYFHNWKQACDKTKDRTKELLKRWRTLPETDGPMDELEDSHEDSGESKEAGKGHGWSVHVWTTWVNRYSIDGGDGGAEGEEEEEKPEGLSPLQQDKMGLFFTELLDLDRDDLVSEQDFEHFCERLAHFADWSTTSPEFHILLEVKYEFIENFILPLPAQFREKAYWRRISAGLPTGTVDCQMWLARWPLLLPECGRFHRFPLFLQYFCKILFGIINKSGSGEISRQELRAFYMSVAGLSSSRCDEIIDVAYKLLTCNEQLTLNFESYKRIYANWLCGKSPNGPGQWAVVPPRGPPCREPFPVDYSALNTDPARLEKYTPNIKTNRHSVIV